MKYLVQAILIAGDVERVTDSIKTDDYKKTLEFVMKRHNHFDEYLYTVLNLETQSLIYKSRKNKYLVQFSTII